MVDMYKRIPAVYAELEGTRSFEVQGSHYVCRYLDFFGNRVEGAFQKGKFDFSKGIILSSICPTRFFDSLAFSTKVANYCTFRFSYSNICFDNLGIVVRDYNTLVECFKNVKTKFSLTLSPIGTVFCGSMSHFQYEKGLLFYNGQNYFTYSNHFEFKGYIRSSEDEIMYVGGLRDRLPSGFGLVANGTQIVYYGQFNKGIPVGKACYFGKRGELNFVGSFNATPLFGTFSRGKRDCFYEGIFQTLQQEGREANFEKYPLTLSSLRESKKIHSLFEDFMCQGVCKHYSDKIYMIKGKVRFGSRSHNGKLEIIYYNGTRFLGNIEDSCRSGYGYLSSNEGKFQLVGDFKKGNQVYGYLIIDSENSNFRTGSYPQVDEVSEQLPIPKKIFGCIYYDSHGRIQVHGDVKVILNDGSVYYGQFINNSITGYGKLYKNDSNQSVYTGQLLYGKYFGVGELKTKEFVYQGEFMNDSFHGFGTYMLPGIVVKGFWQKGLCEYACISYSQVSFSMLLSDQSSDHNNLAFTQLYIIFDTPTLDFSLKKVKGLVEVHFNEATLANLNAAYDDVNSETVIKSKGSEPNMSVPQVRRNSIAQANRMDDPSDGDALARGPLSPDAKNRPQGGNRRAKHAFTIKPYNRMPSNTSKSRLVSRRSLSHGLDDIKPNPRKGAAEEASKMSYQNSISPNLKYYSQVSPSQMALGFAEFNQKIGKKFTFMGRYTPPQVSDQLTHPMGDFGGPNTGFVGVLKKLDDKFAILEVGPQFDQGYGYYRNDSATMELYGTLSGLQIEGIGARYYNNLTCVGEFKKNFESGLCINYLNSREEYIGEYARGQKQGRGIKKNFDDGKPSAVYLFEYSHETLVSLSKIEAPQVGLSKSSSPKNSIASSAKVNSLLFHPDAYQYTKIPPLHPKPKVIRASVRNLPKI